MLRNAVWTLRQGHGCDPAAARLPHHRRAEGGYDRALRLPAPAPGNHRPVVEGGQLLRPPLRARRGLVPRELPEHAPGARPRRRGEPELHVPSARPGARGRARPGREADRARAGSGRPRVLPLPARGRARSRGALVRGRPCGGGRAPARRGGADARRPDVLQPRLVELHVCGSRALRRAARALARRVPAGAAADRAERGDARRARAGARRACSSSSARRRSRSTPTRASSSASTSRCVPRRGRGWREEFAEPNRRLYALLGRELDWA